MTIEQLLDEWSCFQCGQCQYFRTDKCQIDHKHVRFAVPWFKSYDEGQFNSVICHLFDPSDTVPWLKRNFPDVNRNEFDNYFSHISEYIYLTVDNDTHVRYAVHRRNWYYGDYMNEDGTLKWCYRRVFKKSKQSPTGYTLLKEYNQLQPV